MKTFILLFIGLFFSFSLLAQGNSQGKGKGQSKAKTENPGKSGQKGNDNDEENEKGEKGEKGVKGPKGGKDMKDEGDKTEKEEHNKKVWDGTSENGKGPKPSKNQPAKVRSNFMADYPNAQNVSWSKYRGDWTATFGNGKFISTAVYHANGERRDTRTPITKNEMPRNVLDSIFKKRPDMKLEDVIKVEVQNKVKDIFRIKDIIQGKPQYQYYDSEGNLVKYNY